MRKTENTQAVVEDSLLLPPLSSKMQKKLAHLRGNTPLHALYRRTGLAGKTLWDWVQLLAAVAIPLTVSIATYVFNVQQAAISFDQQREATLQSYLDHMSDLLLGNNTGKNMLRLTDAQANDPISLLATARTITVLQRLDGKRKRIVMQFLSETGLVGKIDQQGQPVGSIIPLIGADLSGTDLTLLSLKDTDLADANLTNTNLTDTQLASARLTNADLRGANLSGTSLIDATMIMAHLENAYSAYADFTGANLGAAYCSHAYMEHTNLSYANLSGADLSGADLSGADLSGANLTLTNLKGANLSNADLSDAKITQQQLNQAQSLHNATLPNRSKNP